MTTARTFDARSYRPDGTWTTGPWLATIHAINGIAPESFGTPTGTDTVDLLGGGTRYVEHYPSFDVVFADPYPETPIRKTVRIEALTPEAADLLARVGEAA